MEGTCCRVFAPEMPKEALAVEDGGSDAGLIRRSLQGDADAFGDLYSRYNAQVAVRVRRALPGASFDVGDVVQDAFVRAWCRLPQLRSADRFPQWVCAIALSSARDALRAASRERLIAYDSEPRASDDGLDERLTVHQAMQALPPAQRLAVSLCYLEGLTLGEAANRLGVPRSTVRGRLQTGRAALRARLAQGTGWGQATNPPTPRRPLRAVLSAIQRRNIEQALDLRGQPVILFCGVPLDVDIVASGDDRLHLSGSVWGVGEKAVAAIALQHDRVDDMLAVGPHPGEVFAGTQSHSGGLHAITQDTRERWAGTRDEIASDQGGVARYLRALLHQSALRVSVAATQVHGAWVGTTDPEEWRELSSVLRTNHTSALGWHGPEARGALTVETPPGVTLVVVSLAEAGAVSAHGVQGQVACIGAHQVMAEGHAGDLTLWEAHLKRITGLHGCFRHRVNSCLHGHYGEHSMDRGAVPEIAVADLDGSAEMEVGRVTLALDAPRGNLNILNRFGDTTLRLDGQTVKVTGEVRSLSGRVRLEVPPNTVVPGLTATSVFGEVRWSGALRGDSGMSNWNSPRMLATGEYGGTELRLHLHSEAGSVELQRVATSLAEGPEGVQT